MPLDDLEIRDALVLAGLIDPTMVPEASIVYWAKRVAGGTAVYDLARRLMNPHCPVSSDEPRKLVTHGTGEEMEFGWKYADGHVEPIKEPL